MNVFENIVLPAKLMERNISKKEVMRIAEELEIEGFCQNPTNRCYICKKELFEKIWDIATKEGLNAVAEGSNMDDNGDYRPGLIAVRELGVSSPLRQAELYKEEIRELFQRNGTFLPGTNSPLPAFPPVSFTARPSVRKNSAW